MRYSKFLGIAICTLLLLFSCASPTKPVEIITTSNVPYPELKFGTDSTFEIGTWNIQNYPKESTTNEYVADIIVSMDVDMICFQEIESGTDFYNLVSLINSLDSVNHWSGHRGNSSSYGMNLAVIYKTDRVSNISFLDIFNDDGWSFPRAPLKIEFVVDGQSIVILNNHLKCCGEAGDKLRRLEACETLKSYIVDNFDTNNVIILGDLNDVVTDQQSENVFWSFISAPQDFKIADMDIATGSTQNWSYPTWPSHIDHIIISNELFDEFEKNTSEVTVLRIDDALNDGWTEYDVNISDHRPVVWRFTL